MPDDTNHDMAAQTPSYELDVSREISTDFLEEAHGALYQARIKQLALDFKDDGYDLSTTYAFGPGSVSLVIRAPDPETLQDLARAAETLGHELPDPQPRPHDVRDQDPIGHHGDLPVQHTLTVGLSRRIADAITDLMRGSLISAPARNDLKIFASELWADAYKRAKHAGQGLPQSVSFETWAEGVASSLTHRTGLSPAEVEAVLLEHLAPYEDPETYLDGYPSCLIFSSPGQTRDLLYCLYSPAWDMSNLVAPELLCVVEPEIDPYVIGLTGLPGALPEGLQEGLPGRTLAFHDRPALEDFGCGTPDDLRRLHATITDATTRTTAH